MRPSVAPATIAPAAIAAVTCGVIGVPDGGRSPARAFPTLSATLFPRPEDDYQHRNPKQRHHARFHIRSFRGPARVILGLIR